MAHLLDGNVLIALVFPAHTHHEAAALWIGSGRRFTTCPTVQGTLLRFLLREGRGSADASRVLAGIVGLDRHEQWLDDLTYGQVDLSRVVGHAQLTDAYLAALARAHGGRVASLDRAFAAVAPDVVDLIPT